MKLPRTGIKLEPKAFGLKKRNTIILHIPNKTQKPTWNQSLEFVGSVYR